MGAKDNAELIQKGYEAFAKGDMATIAEVFAPDIRWHIGGQSQITGDYIGQDEVFAFFAKLPELTGGTFSLNVHDMLASDDHVVVLVRELADRNGKSLASDEVHVWHVDGGRATEFWGVPKDQREVDAFWA